MTEWVLVCVIIVLIVGIVLTSVLASRTIKDMLAHVERQRDAHQKSIDALVDRTLAKSWAQYKEWEIASPTNSNLDEAGFRMPTEEDFAEERPFDSASLGHFTEDEE